MKKIIFSLVMLLCLSGCKKDWLIHDLETYLSDLEINEYTIVIRKDYNEEFEFAIAKTKSPERLFLSARTISERGLFHQYSEGQRQPLFEFDDSFYYDYNSNYTNCENNYFLGIVKYDVKSIEYLGEQIDVFKKEFTFNEKKEIISYWIYEYDQSNIDEKLFKISRNKS